MLTQETLKSEMHYDPETGVFTRYKKHKNYSLIAGTVHVMSGKPYITIGVCKRKYPAHTLAWLYMTGEFPNGEMDHIDGNGTNNIFSNLRCVSHIENMKNCKLSSRNKSGVCGVGWFKSIGKWKAQIRINYKTISLGNYDNLFDAVCARKNADARYVFHKNHGQDRLP